MKSGTESRAMLAWFLENYYRLEESDIYDSVCDGHNDKGIDGIYVNEQTREIDVFQTTVSKTDTKTQGDAKLKQLAGTLSQLATVEGAEKILAVANPELRAIAERVNLLNCIKDGYAVRGVFVTNANADSSATTFLSTQSDLVLYDRAKLTREFVSIDKTDPIASEKSFDVGDVPTLPLPIGQNLQMVLAPISAGELVTMDGISNGDLFAWNVRQFLGRSTAVNKSLADSITTAAEHKLFPAFHNGITVLCKTLKNTDKKITISGYAVVNGCQSLTTLHENRNSITNDLKILTKFIQVEPDSALATKITDHTNNQNGTKARDLKSNDPIHGRLQTEIHTKYPTIRYRIKRGERPDWNKDEVLENEMLARILLAFDLKKPEAWSQNYKLFDDLHGEIFARPGVNADRAVFAYDAFKTVLEKLDLMEDQLFATYTLTRWLVLYLTREALMTDDTGRQLHANPSTFFSEPNGRERVRKCVASVIQKIVRLLNGEVKRLQGNPEEFFDHKKELKSREFVQALAAKLIPHYQAILDTLPDESFGKLWEASKKPGAHPSTKAT